MFLGGVFLQITLSRRPNPTLTLTLTLTQTLTQDKATTLRAACGRVIWIT